MDDTNNTQGETLSIFAAEAPAAPVVSELEMLKARARQLNIEFSNNIGLASLKERVNAKLGGTTDTTGDEAEVEAEQPEEQPEPEAVEPLVPAPEPVAEAQVLTTLTGADTSSIAPAAPQPQVNALTGQAPAPAKPAKPKTMRQIVQEKQLALVRIRITNMDPKKADLPGEVITVANEYLGTVRKYVPFGEQTEDGYHVPYCIYNMLKKRTFLNIRTRKSTNGVPKIEQTWAREFAIEVLEPLTRAELSQLATAQAAAGSLNN